MAVTNKYFDAVKDVDSKRTSASVMVLYLLAADELGVKVKSVPLKDYEMILSLYDKMKEVVESEKKKGNDDSKKINEVWKKERKCRLTPLEMNDFVESMYRASVARTNVRYIFSECLKFLVRYCDYKPSEPEMEYISKKEKDSGLYSFIVKECKIEPTDDEVDTFMKTIPEEHQYTWCDAGECACMGCVNRAGKFPWPRRHWVLWVKRTGFPKSYPKSYVSKWMKDEIEKEFELAEKETTT